MFNPSNYVEDFLKNNNISAPYTCKTKKCITFLTDNIMKSIDDSTIFPELIWVLEELRIFFGIEKDYVWDQSSIINIKDNDHKELCIYDIITEYAKLRLEYYRQENFQKKHNVYINSYLAKSIIELNRNILMLSNIMDYPIQTAYNSFAETKLEV